MAGQILYTAEGGRLGWLGRERQGSALARKGTVQTIGEVDLGYLDK